jgi:hypothetical protein
MWTPVTVAIDGKASWCEHKRDRDLLDAFLVAQKPTWTDTSFHALGERWRQIARDEAREILSVILSSTLAYPEPLEPEQIPTTLDEITERFSQDPALVHKRVAT